MISEERLLRAAAEADNIRMASLPDTLLSEHDFSLRFQKKMDRLVKRTDRPMAYFGQRVASIVLVFLLSASIWLALDTNARANFFAWISEHYEQYQQYFYRGSASSEVPTGIYYRLGWLPEGYTEYAIYYENSGVTVLYINSEGQFLSLEYLNSEQANLFLYAESDTYRAVKINGYHADLYLSPDDKHASTVVYIMDNTLFVINGFCTEKDLVKIAENIDAFME